MSRSRRRLLALALLAAAALAAATPPPARADAHGRVRQRVDDHDAIARAVAAGRALPLAEVMARLGDRLGGRVVRIELETEADRLVYEFKVIGPDGRRREVLVDALTAAIVEHDD